MLYTTPLQLKYSEIDLSHRDKIVLAGSCFADEIGQRLQKYRFTMWTNPYGTLYSPLALAYLIEAGLGQMNRLEDRITNHEDVWYSWDHHGSISDLSSSDLTRKIKEINKALNSFLKDCSCVVLTLGTAWVYQLKDNNSFVANCHKHPGDKFHKKLLGVDDTVYAIQRAVRALPPHVKVILSISPVRHLKDGFIENQQSKSTLILAVREILSMKSNIYYFPAYEIMMDELRDYRFYDRDLVHPNSLATDHIWQKFMDWSMTPETKMAIGQLDKILKSLHHRPFQPDSKAHRIFLMETLKQMEDFRKTYPNISLDEEINQLRGKMG